MRKIFLFVFIIIVAASCTDDSVNQSEKVGIDSPLDPKEQNLLLGKGINMGNMLEAPSEGAWGEYLKEDEYFPIIKNVGFNSVRIPVKWSVNTDDKNGYAIDPAFLKRVDKAIDSALSNNLAVIINVHHFNEMMDKPELNRPKLKAIWEQLSAHYAQYPKELFFEILNEPNNKLTPQLWNEILAELISVIRKENPYRTLLVGTATWGGLDGLKDLVIPPSEKNVIVTVHYYNPFQFTHQGAEWVDNSVQWLGTKWGNSQEYSNMQKDFNKILEWSLANNRPVNIGEFGAYWKADHNSRVLWTKNVAGLCNSFNFSFNYWEFSSGFGIYDNDNNKWDEELRDALLK